MESKPQENAEGKVDPSTQVVMDKAKEFEQPLTEEETNMDYSKMHALDLGPQGNYKTRMVQNRWE